MRVNAFVEHDRQNPPVHSQADGQTKGQTGGRENICGVLVQAAPTRWEETRAGLEALPGVEVHAVTEQGKMVVTVEDAAGQWAGDTLGHFNAVPGVLSVALIYHHFEDLNTPSPQTTSDEETVQ